VPGKPCLRVPEGCCQADSFSFWKKLEAPKENSKEILERKGQQALPIVSGIK
jgi:hypothetical protein